MLRKKILLAISTLYILITTTAAAQNIDRQPIVRRNNPHVESVDTMSSLTIGNGRFAVTVDATGLQTYPEYYSNGIPLGTFSEWGWHSFPNINGYKPEEILLNHDFHRGHQELYAAEFKEKGRRHDAANYLRANPHRMHLGCFGFDFGGKPNLKDVSQTLDMWTGKITSEFTKNGFRYHVETVCHPDRDLIAVRIQRRMLALRKSIYPIYQPEKIPLRFRFPYPTGKHSDDGCDWNYQDTDIQHPHHVVESIRKTADGECLRIRNDSSQYFVDAHWKSDAKGLNEEFLYEFAETEDSLKGLSDITFSDVERASVDYWKRYWQTGGIIDFSRVSDPRARELERREVQSLYLLAVNDQQNYPPAETGLTYNSWFGKFHLEMIYWHQAWQALWGHPEALERSLDWYFRAEPMAREIARRQGFKGVRWMKMTDPWAGEAPSNVGSYLIWQQPHVIYLSDLLYRAALADKAGGEAKADKILKKFAPLVQETAEFMYDFAEKDSISGQYNLRGYIPAQETLKADSVQNSPFELSYWREAMIISQLWRMRQGLNPDKNWDDLIKHIAPLPSKDGVYLTAEGAPLIDHRAEQTDSPMGNDKFASDHPMPLGAFGMMPESNQFTVEGMNRTYDWVLKNWNWQKTWGWDYPMTAMCATRLHRPEDAINALLMAVPKNTYLPQGHNWQSNRLRCYLPGNGGLLLALALMSAGYDASEVTNPGFPSSWDVVWEGILPQP